jgi:DNA-binding NtrC family response regulator
MNRPRPNGAKTLGEALVLEKRAVLVGGMPDWPKDLKGCLGRAGYLVEDVTELALASPLLTDDRIRAIFVPARPLAASDLLLLRRIRATAPRTAIVVLTQTPTQPDLKRAFESGATAFLSWPASAEALRQAIESGDGVPGDPRRP